MSERLWPLALLLLAACTPSGDDTDDTDETDVDDTDETDGGDDTDGDDTDGDDTDDTDEPGPTDWFGLAGTWSGTLMARLNASIIPPGGGPPGIITQECDPIGTITVSVSPASAPHISWVSHSCEGFDLGTVTLTGDFSRDGDGAPIMSDNKVTIAGEIASTTFGDDAVPWFGTFENNDSDSDVDVFLVDQEGEVPSFGTATLRIEIDALRTASEM